MVDGGVGISACVGEMIEDERPNGAADEVEGVVVRDDVSCVTCETVLVVMISLAPPESDKIKICAVDSSISTEHLTLRSSGGDGEDDENDDAEDEPMREGGRSGSDG